MRVKSVLKYLVVTTVIFSCNRNPKQLSGNEFVNWVNSGDRNFNKSKIINGVSIEARYLPASYLAYKEYIKSDSASYDSLYNSYKCGITFLITLQADKSSKTYGNLMYYKVFSDEDFKKRTSYLNFRSSDFITLNYNNSTYSPVLSNFEGYNQIGNKVSFTVVYTINEFNCGVLAADFKDIVLEFDDPYWDLGKINFDFNKNIFIELPEIQF